ncbi:MAG: hypothetical protein ACKKL4_01400 [Patescibacteria group bacterium]
MKLNIHSVSGRIAIGKFTGLVVGLLVVLVLPYAGIPTMSMFSLGMVIMFVLMGSMIGFFGQFDHHPSLGFGMPWWMRGSLVGFVFLLMFILLSYDELKIVMESPLVSWVGLSSPWWILLDGIFYGALMGYIQTTIAGEGGDLPLS